MAGKLLRQMPTLATANGRCPFSAVAVTDIPPNAHAYSSPCSSSAEQRSTQGPFCRHGTILHCLTVHPQPTRGCGDKETRRQGLLLWPLPQQPCCVPCTGAAPQGWLSPALPAQLAVPIPYPLMISFLGALKVLKAFWWCLRRAEPLVAPLPQPSRGWRSAVLLEN